MEASDLHPQFAHEDNAEADPPFDPAAYWHVLRTQHAKPEAALWDSPGFIRHQKENFDLPATDYSAADSARLNPGQRLAFSQLQQVIDASGRPASDPGPLRLLVAGTAGTGKSYLIKCLMKYAQDRLGVDAAGRAIQLVAPTGTAAFNISGRTIHSLLSLPIPLGSSLTDLSPVALASLQERLRGLQLLVVDEMSMIGRKMLGAMDERLRQVFPARRGEWFGGVSVALMGDFGQLPPVLNLPMYSLLPGQGLSRSGKAAFAAFAQGVVLEKVERVVGDSLDQQDFRAILRRLRAGQVTGWVFDSSVWISFFARA